MPTTKVGTHTAYYDEQGSGHPLLLITGLGGTRFGWWKQIEPFSRRYRVIYMDNRDAGDSAACPLPYSAADMAGDAAGLIQNLGLGPTYVAGISMGGFISLELAIGYPALVEKLVLTATSAGGPSQVPPAPAIQALLMRSEAESVEERVRRTYPALAGPGYMRAHPEDLDEIVRNNLAKPMTADGYMRQLGACMGHSVADRLSQVKAPTLVIHGDADPLVPYANGQFLAAHIPGARLSTYPGVGHLVPIEAPVRYNREVMAFLG